MSNDQSLGEGLGNGDYKPRRSCSVEIKIKSHENWECATKHKHNSFGLLCRHCMVDYTPFWLCTRLLRPGSGHAVCSRHMNSSQDVLSIYYTLTWVYLEAALRIMERKLPPSSSKHFQFPLDQASKSINNLEKYTKYNFAIPR